MSDFPNNYDDDATLPPVNDNIQDIGGEAINALRDAVFNMEYYLGIGGAGSTDSISTRLGVSLDDDGNIKSSAIASLGLITLPITEDQISSSANIPESKLKLDYRTKDLFNYVQDLAGNVNSALGWISLTGIKLDPHISGAVYKHTLSQIDVSSNANNYLKNNLNLYRDNTNSYTVLDDLNEEFLNHQFADGYSPTGSNITTINGLTYPSNYAHIANGIFINTSGFGVIPQTANDLQKLVDFIDSSSIFLYGTRIQNLYSNGISRVSRSSSLTIDGYGASIIPSTSATAYLLNTYSNSAPFDDINYGDDIVEFTPASSELTSNSFDEKFALVKVGDILRINYGTVEVKFLIKEKKYIQSSGNKKFIVRINGKNLFYTTSAIARIDRPLVNNTKYGVLATVAANNNFSGAASLIVGNPRAAQTLGVGFNASDFDSTHYLLYLVLYPNGNPSEFTILPGIDVTGNRGTTPGSYTLASIVEATNNEFRKAGYNYRFIAYSYNGDYGIMLADSYNNAGFSIVSGVVGDDGIYDQTSTNINYPNNVVDVFPAANTQAIDPLGLGINGVNIASPTFKTSYGSAEAAAFPTKILLPLKRNNYYINGTEREQLNIESNQLVDVYGDGYWAAKIQSVNVFPGPSAGRVQATYRVLSDLSTSNLKIGKTIVVQSLGVGNIVDFGRFIIQSISFNANCPDPSQEYTDITVYDSVHGTGVSPTTTSVAVGDDVALYFNSDSISFNKENSSDFSEVTPFKRHFEILVDQNGYSFTHERARINISGADLTVNNTTLFSFTELSKLNIVKVSPKLRGYQFSSLNKITLNLFDYNNTTGIYDGYLASYDGTTISHCGPVISGKKGQTTRFYDETLIDYIDICFDVNTSIADFSNKFIDFQLFPTLSLDDEIMLVGTCQFNDTTNYVNFIQDERQFGNVGEKDLSSSALNLISLPEKLLHSNGIISGFDLQNTSPLSNPNGNQIYLQGGIALVNGKIVQQNNETINIQYVKEKYVSLYNINWILCLNDKSEYQLIPMLDYDSTLGTPNNPNRVLQAFNVINGSTYNIDSVIFSDLINNRKDLTPLYIIASTVNTSPVSISLSVIDIRKYINDSESNLPLKLTTSSKQGNFKKPESIFNWLKYNSDFNSIAYVKGADSISGIINTAITLDFSGTVIIDGENSATLTMNQPVIIGSNITLRNLNIIFNGGLSTSSIVNNVLFENCDITINVPDTSPTNNTIFELSGGSNFKVKDCNVTVQYSSLYDEAEVFRGTLFNVSSYGEFVIDNSVIDVQYEISAGAVTPGDVIVLTSTPDAKITNSSFSGNFNRFINLSNSNNLKVISCSVTSNYDPNSGASPDEYDGVSYNTSDLVNNGNGYIYSDVSSTLLNVLIDDVTFNYSPISVSNDRYSFINFELSSNNSYLTGLITNCKFNSLNVSGTVDDFRSAVAIINTASSVTSPAVQPTINVKITGNTTNHNQSIICTSKTSSGLMVYPALVPLNCVIKNNVCGTIGYWVGAETKFLSLDPAVNSLNDKQSGLTIRNNSCHYIATVDSSGQYFLVSKISTTSPTTGGSINQCAYPSGKVLIKDNNCSWIHAGVCFDKNSSLSIKDNTLSAYDVSYLSNNGHELPNAIYYTENSTVPISTGYAIFVSSNKHKTTPSQDPGEGNDSSCVISGNTTSTGYWTTTSYTKTTYKYPLGYIYSQSSSNITNNILKGVDDTSNYGSLILVGGLNNVISNNKVYREGKSILAYVTFASFQVANIYELLEPAWTGSDTNGIVTENYFDSPYINDSTLSEAVINLSMTHAQVKNWIVEKNINQTVTATFDCNSGNHRWTSDQDIFPPATDAGIYILAQDDSDETIKITYAPSSLLPYYYWTVPLYSILPKNVKITSSQVTVTNTNLTTVPSSIGLSLLDTTSGTTDQDTGNLSFTLAKTLSVPVNNTYRTNESSSVVVRFTLTMQSSVSVIVKISKITVKYRW